MLAIWEGPYERDLCSCSSSEHISEVLQVAPIVTHCISADQLIGVGIYKEYMHVLISAYGNLRKGQPPNKGHSWTPLC